MLALRRLKRRVGRFLFKGGAHRLWAFRYMGQFEAVKGSPPEPDALAVLVALNAGRFRGELEVLATSGFRVLKAPYALQARLLGLYFDPDDDVLAIHDNERLLARKEALHSALQLLLTCFYSRLKVDATIGAAIHYKQDIHWGAVSDRLGYPFIVLHRENLAASEAIVDHNIARASRIDPFPGTLLITHNDIMRRIFVESGYIPKTKAVAAGAMRMDNFAISQPPDAPTGKLKQIAFFSFGPGAGILNSRPPHWPRNEGSFFHNLCIETHVAIFEFARDNPDIQVTVKPKWGGTWLNRLDALFSDRKLNPRGVSNFRIVPDIDVHALIRSSNIVVGFASTVLLEAAIMQRPVVVPMFAEAADPEFRRNIMLSDFQDIFDSATSPEHLKYLLSLRIEDGYIGSDIMARRRNAFETYIGPLNGKATCKTVTAIQSALNLI